MNKFYTSLLVLSIAIAGGATAQKTLQPPSLLEARPSMDPVRPVGPAASGARSTVIWEDDFSVAGNWSVAHSGPINLDWQVGTNLSSQGDYPTPAILSTTAGNGYAMYDSDAGNNNTGNYEYAHITNATPFSTVGYPNVVVEFQTQYRRFNNEQTFLLVSTNNTDWPTNLTPSTNIAAMSNVYHVFAPGELTQGISPGNPVTRRINISAIAGDQPQVWVRILFVGIWGYTWYVDDLKVVDQPAYDLVLQNGFLSHTGNGEEYGRIPSQHLNPTMRVGGDFLNFGINPMTNITLNMEVAGASPFSATSTPLDLASGIAGSMDQSVNLPNGGALGNGDYNAVFTLSSNEDPQEDDLGNNVYLRNFKVAPEWYSVDGIGNHPPGYQSLFSIGTNSFVDVEDGLVVFNYYPMRVAQTVYGVEIGITSTTQAGSYLIVSIHDTTFTADLNLPPAIYSTDVVDVTTADIAAGKVTVVFDVPQTLQPNGYYVGATLYSNGGATLLRVVDDLTVPQPGYASGIQIPSDRAYTNGNAFHIRLATTNTVGLPERSELGGISIHPNPSTDGLLYLRSAETGSFNVEVTNMLGERVMNARTDGNTTIDLRGRADGVYMVRVSNATGAVVHRIVLD